MRRSRSWASCRRRISRSASTPSAICCRSTRACRKQIKLELIDVDRNPSVAAQNEVRSLRRDRHPPQGPDRARHRPRRNRTSPTRSSRSVSGEARTIYFTQGHGEKDPASNEGGGYMAASESLKRENYTVEKLVLAQQGGVPDNANDRRRRRVRASTSCPARSRRWRSSSRRAASCCSSSMRPAPTSRRCRTWPASAKKWGIDVGDNLVLDQTGMGQLFGGAAETPVAANYPSHPITSRLDVMTAFRIARSVTPVSGGSEGHTAQSIVETSARSWAEADLKSLYDRKAAARRTRRPATRPARFRLPPRCRRRSAGPSRRTSRRPTAKAPRRSRRPASSCSATPTSRRTRSSRPAAIATCS